MCEQIRVAVVMCFKLRALDHCHQCHQVCPTVCCAVLCCAVASLLAESSHGQIFSLAHVRYKYLRTRLCSCLTPFRLGRRPFEVGRRLSLP